MCLTLSLTSETFRVENFKIAVQDEELFGFGLIRVCGVCGLQRRHASFAEQLSEI